MTTKGVKAPLVGPDTLFAAQWRHRIVDLATEHRLPAMYEWQGYPEAGS
jgi:hypothetical protein